MAQSVTDPAATKLARGAITPTDILRVRRQYARAEQAFADELHAAAARCEREARRLERALAESRDRLAGARPRTEEDRRRA